MSAKIMGLAVVFFGLVLGGVQDAAAFSPHPVSNHSVTATKRVSEAAKSAQILILVDNEGDGEACDPGEDCSSDAKAAPKHNKKSNKKNKKAGAASNNEACDPGEDCSGEAD